MPSYLFTNLAQTALTGSSGTTSPVAGTVETWTVVSSSAFPVAVTGVSQFAVNDLATGFKTEVILVTNVSGTTWTVTRGAESTTPIAHIAGATVQLVTTAGFLGNAMPYLNVVNFGADPTGTNDSTAAIQAALNGATAGQIVWLPSGTYKTSAPLTVPPGVRLMGTGGNVLSLTDYGSTIKPSASWAQGVALASAVILLLNQTDGGYAGASEEQQIIGVQIDGTSLPVVADGIQAYGAVNNVLLRDVTIDLVTGNGVNQTTAHSATADTWRGHRVLVHRAGLSGFVLASPDSTWHDCEAIGCGQTGGTGNTQPAWSIATCSNSIFSACRGENTSGTGNGYTYNANNSSGTGVVFTACTTNGNGGYGIELTQAGGGSPPVTVTGCRFYDDGWNPFVSGTGGGNFAGIFITAAASHISITGTTVVVNPANAGNTPQYGLRITSSSSTKCRISVANSLLWGNTAGLSNDGSCPLLILDPSVILASGASGSPTYVTPATTMLAAATANPVPTTTADLTFARTGATAQTIRRDQITQATIGTATGTLYVRAIYLPAGVPVNNITWAVGTTAKTGGTHGWYVLLDSGLVVRAVSADQTDAATTWGTVNAEQTLSVSGSAYVTTYSGLYYVGVMVAQSAGTQPNFSGGPNFTTNDAARAPSLGGTSSTGQTTPPATGTTMTAISGLASSNFYAWTS